MPRGAHAFAPKARVWAATIEPSSLLWPAHPLVLAYWRIIPKGNPHQFAIRRSIFTRIYSSRPLLSQSFPLYSRYTKFSSPDAMITTFNEYHQWEVPQRLGPGENAYNIACSSMELELSSTPVRFKLTSIFTTQTRLGIELTYRPHHVQPNPPARDKNQRRSHG